MKVITVKFVFLTDSGHEIESNIDVPSDKNIRWTRSDIDDVFISIDAVELLAELTQISSTNTIKLVRI